MEITHAIFLKCTLKEIPVTGDTGFAHTDNDSTQSSLYCTHINLLQAHIFVLFTLLCSTGDQIQGSHTLGKHSTVDL
jgi:hypothetical protein